jgi:diaminopimelate epimerase
MQNSIQFFKYQALGNDFIVIELDDLEKNGLGSIQLQSQFAVTICDRNFGVGSDGLLVVDNERIIFFNPDGTLDQCGNGIRVSALHAFRKIPFSEKIFKTHGGNIAVSAIQKDEISSQFFTARHPVESSEPKKIITTDGVTVEGFLVHLGTPHFCVTNVKYSNEFGKQIEHASSFAESVTADFIESIDYSKGEIFIRIWERSVGETLGCGTGSIASALTASNLYKQKYNSERYDWIVKSRGGTLSVKLITDSQQRIVFADLTGTAHFVFKGEFLID